MPYETILYEKAGPVVTITLNRPHSLNAITPDMTAELHAALEVADADPEARAIVLTGAGRAFSAGYAIGPRPDGGSPLDARGVEVAEFLKGWWTRDGATTRRLLHLWELATPVALQDITELTFFQELIHGEGSFGANVILGVNVEGDSYEADDLAWHIGDTQHDPDVLGADTFVSMDGANPDQAKVDAPSEPRWWTPNEAGDGHAGTGTCYATLADLVAGCTDVRFEPDSELSRLNARADEAVQVSATLLRAVEAALWAARLSDGMVDPTLIGELERAGYANSRSGLASAPLADALATAPARPAAAPSPRAAWRRIRVNPDRGTIRLPPGVRIDLGGSAKGLAVDLGCGPGWYTDALGEPAWTPVPGSPPRPPGCPGQLLSSPRGAGRWRRDQ